MKDCGPTDTIALSIIIPSSVMQRWTLTSACRSVGFDSKGEVICTETPAGEVAMTTHIGGYDKLADAYDAIHSWRAATDRTFASWSWEIYGDWTDDTTKLETQVVYLLI
jgi:hypothetical protein